MELESTHTFSLLFPFSLKPQVPKVVEKVFFTTALPVAGNTGKLDTELAPLSLCFFMVLLA